MTVTITTHSPAETQALAERLAKLLRPGDVLAYTGPMGAGKTTFTVGLARGLSSSDWVSSPTFALVQEYRGPVPLCHFDFYRITGVDDLYATGFFDYLDGTRVLAVEWSEREPSASALSRWKTIAAASPFPPPPAMTGWPPCPPNGAAPCRAKIGLGGVAALDRRKPGFAGRKPAFGRFWPISDFSGAARSPCPLNHETKPKGETP